MKTKLLTGLIAMTCLVSAVSICHAAPTISEAVENNFSAQAIQGYCQAQVYTVPVLKEGETAQGRSETNDRYASLMNETAGPVVTYARVDNFFADCETFHVEVDIMNLKDTRNKLSLEIVDQNNKVVAQSTDAFYYYERLVYTMELLSTVNEESSYSLQFSYDGKYEITYNLESVVVAPVFGAAIKNIEVVDRENNAFKLYLANASVGETYTLFYDEDDVSRTATVQSGKVLSVEFGTQTEFNIFNRIYLCEEGATSKWDYISRVTLYDFSVNQDEEENGDISNDGLNCTDIIEASSTNMWFNLYQKGFNYLEYDASDLDNIDAYMYDVTAGEKVGTLSSKEFRENYGEIEGNIAINKDLNETHKYVIVCDDGYSLRVSHEITVTSEKILEGVYVSDLNDNSYGTTLPSGITKFYAFVGQMNLTSTEYKKIETGLYDMSGNLIKAGKYNTSTGRFIFTLTSKLAAGTYTIKATFEDVTCETRIEVIGEGNGACWQVAHDAYMYDGKVYVFAGMENTTYDPADLNYKLELSDGSLIDAEFGRLLYTENNRYSYFTVVVNEITDVMYETQYAYLRMYDGDAYIVSQYANNSKIWYIEQPNAPFVYNQCYETATDITFFTEGFGTTGTYTLSAIDDLTGKSVTAKAASASKNSVTFKKSALKSVHTYCGLLRNYNMASKEFFIERDGEFAARITSYSLGSFILNTEFGFQKTFTDKTYDILNLPYQDYAYYKLADSEDGLSSVSYKKIETGLLYDFGDVQGIQTVYAKFKTSDGQISDVKTATITRDTVAPVFSFTEAPASVYRINSNSEIEISIHYSSDEDGEVYCLFYDQNNNLIGYESSREIEAGEDYLTSVYFWAEDANYTDAAKLVIYVTDKAGNKTEEYTFDVTVEPYVPTPLIFGVYDEYYDEADLRIGVEFECITEENAFYIAAYDEYDRFTGLYPVNFSYDGYGYAWVPYTGNRITVKAIAMEDAVSLKPMCESMERTIW